MRWLLARPADPSTVPRVSAPSLIILALGDWPGAHIRVTTVASGLRLTEALEAVIDATWETALQRHGVNLFDGPLCRLEAVAVDAHGLHLSLSPTTYRIFIGTNGSHPEWADQHGPQVMANPVGTSVALLSSDGMLVFGRRSQRVALYPGFAHPFGGTMEPSTDGTPLDILGEMRRELTEEAGLAAQDLLDLRVIALIEDRHLRQPELVYAARTTLTAAEIASRLDQHEHTACWLLPDTRAEIEATLGGSEPITPVLAGTLLAWGWRRFGEEWLQAHLTRAEARLQPCS